MGQLKQLRPIKVRTAWISDVHLGFRGCSAELLLDFLHNVECETLYLVGDIIDLWSMKRGLYWPQQHNNVVRTLLGKAKHGTRIIYVPGNHDEAFRDHVDSIFGNVEIRREAMHETRDGRLLLLRVVRCLPSSTILGWWRDLDGQAANKPQGRKPRGRGEALVMGI